MAAVDAPIRFPLVTAPRASILITAWRQAPALRRCLASIAEADTKTPFEIVVSLNEPSSELVETLNGQLTGVKVLASKVNRGFGGVCNRAARHASGDLLVLLNDDVIVEPGWLDHLVSAADAHPEAGAIGGQILTFDGALQEAGTVLWSDGRVTLVNEVHRAEPAPEPGVRRTDYCSAALLLVRKTTWESVAGIDEGYFPAYCEDVDLCLKIHATGQAVLFEPASVVRHVQGSSASLPYRLFLRDRNTNRLVARWAHVLASRPSPDLTNPVAIGRAVRAAAERELQPGPGPLLGDTQPDKEDEFFLQRELELVREYAAFLESQVSVMERAAKQKVAARVVRRLRSIVRGIPGADPLWRRLTGGRG